MKNLLLSLLLLLVGHAFAFAQKYMTRTGKIYFSAIIPNTPEVEAINNEAPTILDAGTGEIICQVPVKSFKFKRELMQEHFNENYMESDKYPRSEFRGAVTNISKINFTKDGVYEAVVTGKLTIHGVTHDITETGSAIVKGNTVTLKAKFIVRIKEYNITIPTIVADKVAQEATIIVETGLVQK